MHSSILFAISPIIALGSCHAVILNAQGVAGSPPSVGFQVDPAISRNCTGISPCQQDTTIIRDAEIKENIANSCGRTELKGNIDIGENTENALAAGAVTQVKAGSEVVVTLHQVNADGAGPFVCDLDETSNAGVKFTNLTVGDNVPGQNGLSQAKTQSFNITVKMPDRLKCTGASTGNVCTVRCRNNSVAGPFGGCFAVQQTDTVKTVNTVDSIDTKQSLQDVTAQVAQNQADFAVAVGANAQAGSDDSAKNLAVVNALLKETVVGKPSPQQTLAPGSGGVDDGLVNPPNKGGNGDNGSNGNGVDNGNKNGNKGVQGGLGVEDGQGGQGGAKKNRGNRKQSKKNRNDNAQN